MADGFGKKHPAKEVTPFLMSIARRMEGIKSLLAGKAPLLTKETAKVGFSKTYFENDKLLRALPGFSFVPLEQTIKKACEKYLGMVNAVQP